jgi:hypothetical protein
MEDSALQERVKPRHQKKKECVTIWFGSQTLEFFVIFTYSILKYMQEWVAGNWRVLEIIIN